MKAKFGLIVVMTFIAVQVIACAAITKKGTQCKRAPSPGSQYCWQHGGDNGAAQPRAEERRSVIESHSRPEVLQATQNARVDIPADTRTPEEWTLQKMWFLDKKLREYVNKGKLLPEDLKPLRRFAHLSFVDNWDTPFRYLHGADRYRIISAGPDKKFDTDDDICITYPSERDTTNKE